MRATYEHLQPVPSAPNEAMRFGSRRQLLEDLALAVRPDLGPKVLAIFALDGFRECRELLGRFEAQALVAGLTQRLEQVAISTGAWYRPREDEFALLTDAERSALDPLLARAAGALSDADRPVPVRAACGVVVVPDEASDPIAALRLADERLATAQPGRKPRERRRVPRPGTVAHVAGAAAAPEGTLEPLQLIHREIVDASVHAERSGRIDRLVDVATTLAMLADAVRIDTRDPTRLQGQPRDAARVPLLIKELAVKLAALEAVQGPAIVQALRLVREPIPVISDLSPIVLMALDQVSAALESA